MKNFLTTIAQLSVELEKAEDSFTQMEIVNEMEIEYKKHIASLTTNVEPAQPLIELSKYEKKLILVCKGHLKKEYPWRGEWHETMKPLFLEIYGWDPDSDKNYEDYLRGLFNKLLDVHMKIKTDYSSENAQLKELFSATFNKGISNDAERPIHRAIHALCALIQGVIVVENGQPRFSLDLTI